MHTIETRKRAYSKVKERRKLWFKKNGPCKICKSWKKLELDHIDPKTKISHCIWSWSEERRIQELKKCQILCNKCHKEKTKIYLQEKFKGVRKPRFRTPSANLIKIWIKLRENGLSFSKIGLKYNYYASTVRRNLISRSSLSGKASDL